MRRMVAFIADEDYELVSNEAVMVATYESLADDVKQNGSLKICRGVFFSGLSQHFLELLEKIDDMADAAKDAATAATQTSLHSLLFQSLLEGEVSMYGMIDSLNSCVKALGVAIRSLSVGADRVIEGVLEVRRIEKLADEVKEGLMKQLYAKKSQADLLTLLQTKEFILSLDAISDAAENAAEALLVILAKAE